MSVARTNLALIRNDNPDKGTETFFDAQGYCVKNRLEMITPIRGRKQAAISKVLEDIPD